MTRQDLYAMIKADLEKVVENGKVTNKIAKEFTDTLFAKIVEAAKNDGEVVLPGLGKLKLVETAPRSGVTNGVKWEKPAGKTIKLRLSSTIKESL
jgi:nucleoid DNA-binding protein